MGPTEAGTAETLFHEFGENAGHAGPLRRSRDGVAFHRPPQRAPEAEAMNWIRAPQLRRSVGAHMIGEDLDNLAAPRQFIRQPRHERLDAAHVRPEALRGDGDQGRHRL